MDTSSMFKQKGIVQFDHSVVPDSVTSWTKACQASLSINNSWSQLKLMSTESVMPSNHLIPGEGLGYRNMKKGRNVVEQSACTLFVHYPFLTFSNHVYGVFLFPIL